MGICTYCNSSSIARTEQKSAATAKVSKFSQKGLVGIPKFSIAHDDRVTDILVCNKVANSYRPL